MTVQRLQGVNDFLNESCSLWQSCGQTSRCSDTLVCVLRTPRSSRRPSMTTEKVTCPDFRSGFPHLVESLFLPRIRDFIAQPHLSFFAPCPPGPRSSFDECRGSAGTLWVSQSVVRFWIPYFWITSTPTSLLTIYSALLIGRMKKYMAWKNRIIGVGTDLMSEKFQLWLSFENLRRDSPVFKFKFTLECL